MRLDLAVERAGRRGTVAGPFAVVGRKRLPAHLAIRALLQGDEGGVREAALGALNRLAAQQRVFFHHLELVVGQLARFEQDVIRNSNFAYIVQRRSFGDLVNVFRGEKVAITCLLAQVFGK